MTSILSENTLLNQSASTPRYKSLMQMTLIILTISLSPFYFGYCIVYFGQVPIASINLIFDNPTIDPDLSSGLLNGAIPFGALFGALSSSILLAKFSRRQCLLIVNALALIVGAVIFIKNYYLLAIARMGQGICIGFYSSLAYLIVKQISPKEISGAMGALTSAVLTFGLTFACFFRFLLTRMADDPNNVDTWYYLFGFPLITVSIQSLILIFIFPYETPKYFLVKDKRQECLKLLNIIYKEQFVEQVLKELVNDMEESQRNIHHTVQSEGNQDSEKQSLMVSPKNSIKYFTLIVALHLAIMQQFAGINALTIYGGNIASKSLHELKDILPTLINSLQFLTNLITSYLLTKFGRKAILQCGCFVAGISCALISLGFFLLPYEDKPDFVPDGAGPPIILTGLFLFMTVFGFSLGPIVWLYIPEIIQPQFIPYSTTANWIASCIVIFLFPIVSGALPEKNPAPLFIFFACWCFGSFIFNQKVMVETKDKTEKEISQEYALKKFC